jgi:hypothetical protein
LTVKDEEIVHTLSEHMRQAWRLESDSGEMPAVEHETGIEILVLIGIGLSVNAITAFTTAAWNGGNDGENSRVIGGKACRKERASPR